MDLALVQCPNCVKVLQYYDYMSHQEICNNYESFTNKGALTNEDIDADDENEDENEDEDEDYFDYRNKGFKGTEATLDDNRGELGMSLIDMYNPMFNRGFINHRYSNMDDNMYNNMDTDIRDNSFENLLTNIENLDIGLGRENIEQYGCIIAITEEIECSICLNNYEIGSEFYNMKCMHSFCKMCSEVWFESRSFCPLCNTNLKL